MMTESSFLGDLSLWVKQYGRTFPPLMPVMISISQTVLSSSTVNMIHLLSSLHPASLTACVWLQCSDWETETRGSGPVKSVSEERRRNGNHTSRESFAKVLWGAFKVTVCIFTGLTVMLIILWVLTMFHDSQNEVSLCHVKRALFTLGQKKLFPSHFSSEIETQKFVEL